MPKGLPKVDAALEENVEAIRAWERATSLKRTQAERLSDWIVGKASGAPALALHAVWFIVWVIWNAGVIPGLKPFDPFRSLS
jgi:uncharacterized membrane protein